MATSYTETPDRSKETPFTHNYNADGSQNTTDPLSVFYKSPGSTSPGETPTRYTQDDGSDPIASAYERMAQPPDDRESIRAQALRDVQAQLDAQTAFYAKQREVEQQRLAKAANLSASRVSALGLQRGLSGSSVVEGEKAQDANLSAQEEAASMSQLNAQEANAKAGITGAATSAADEQYAAQVAAAQAAKLKQLDYLATLKPKERAPITVSAGQSVIDPETGEVIYTSSPADEGKSYILAPGQTIVDGSGKVLYTAPQKEEAAKTYTVSAGQAIVDAQGNVIYQSKPEDTGKTYTLNPGQTVIDASGNVIYQAPSDKTPQTITLSPGQSAFDSTGKVIAAVPASETSTKTFTLSPGQTVFDASGKPIAALPGLATTTTEAPKTIETSEGTLQWDKASGSWKPVTLNGAPVANAANAAKTAAQAETAKAAAESAQVVQGKVAEAKNLITATSGLGTLGRLGASKIPGTKSYALAQVIATIKSNLGLSTLQQMKMGSGNGSSGLGALSDMEMKLLTDSVASLDLGLDDTTLTNNLNFISQKYQKFIDALAAPAGAPTGGDVQYAPDGTQYEQGPDGLYYPKANGGPTASTTGVTKALTSIPTDVKWGSERGRKNAGECGALVNDVAGLRMGDSLQSKIAVTDPRLKPDNVAVGDVFVQEVTNDPEGHGHTGLINRIGQDARGRFAIVTEANYKLNGMTTHDRKLYLNDPKIKGFAKPRKAIA